MQVQLEYITVMAAIKMCQDAEEKTEDIPDNSLKHSGEAAACKHKELIIHIAMKH